MIDRTACTAPRHGGANDYRYGCRCPDAREADRIYRKRLRENRHQPAHIPAVGTVRRLQALATIGHTFGSIAAELGVTTQAVERISKAALVRRITAARIGNIYDRWSGTPGPSTICRRRAVARGWAPPLAWDNIDDPNEKPHLNLDRRKARIQAQWTKQVRRLVDAGHTQRQITAQLGAPERLVRHICQEMRSRIADTTVAA